MHKQPSYLPAVMIALLILLAGCSTLSPQTSGAAQPTATNAPAATLAAATATAPAAATTASTATIAPAATSAGGATATPASANVPAGSIVYNIEADKSTAQYRVREQLAGINFPTDAIGKTGQITGSIAVKSDGSIISANSGFTVDLSTLASDKSMRDNFLRRAVLQTDQYKNATFVPKQVTGLPSPLPTSGQVNFKITGDMTIRNVTKPVTWDVTGSIQNGTATGVATTSFTFEDFSLTQPQVAVVLNIVDHIALEVDITLQRAGQ